MLTRHSTELADPGVVPSLADRWSHHTGGNHIKVVPCHWRATVPAARVGSEIASRSHQPTALLVFRKSSELINPCVREVKDIRPEFIGVAPVALVARDSGAHGSAVHTDEASEQPFAFLHLVGHLPRSGDRASRRFSVAPPGSVPDQMIQSISLNVLDRAE